MGRKGEFSWEGFLGLVRMKFLGFLSNGWLEGLSFGVLMVGENLFSWVSGDEDEFWCVVG
jgi:hypothetical protein